MMKMPLSFSDDEFIDGFRALALAASAAARTSDRVAIATSFKRKFPDGWRELCDSFSGGLAVALAGMRPRAVAVLYGVDGEGLTIDVEMVPLPSVQVEEQLERVSDLYIEKSASLCAECGEPSAAACDCKKPTAEDSAARVQVFSGPALGADYIAVGRDDKAASRLKDVFRRVREHEGTRVLSAPLADWSSRLDALAERFPNFQPLLQTTLRAHLRLRAASLHARLAPILLVGPPGVGKTLFASTLAAEVFGCEFAKINIVEETNGSGLCGSSVFWSNSQPGKVFDLLSRGADANPLVLLDEVDKASAESRYDPLAGLYTLLEADTARTFEDQSVPDVRVDASHVRWIATANGIDRIPAPLLSRMVVVHVRPPTADERSAIARRMLRSLVEKLNIGFEGDVPPDLDQEIGHLSQREVRTTLEVAVGLALDRGESCLSLAAWRQARPVATAPTPLGFRA